MGGSSSVFLTEDLANKLSTKSIKEFYAFENECIDGQLSIEEMHELFSKKYDELLFKDTEDHSMKPGVTKQSTSHEKLRTHRLTRRITALNHRGWGTDAAAIARAELRAKVNERYSKVSKTTTAAETKHKPAPVSHSLAVSPSKGSPKKEKGSRIIGRTFGSLSTPSLLRTRVVSPSRHASPSPTAAGSRNATPLRQVRTKQEQVQQSQGMGKSRSTRSVSSLVEKGMPSTTTGTTTASSPSSRVTTAECAKHNDSESDMSDNGSNAHHPMVIERCTSASSDESGTSGFFSESDDEETLAGLTFLSSNKEKEVVPAWRRRLSVIPEHFECRLCRKIFNSQSMLDTHIQHSQIHRQAVLDQRRRYATAFAEAERLQKLLRFTVQRFQETLHAQRAYREGNISLSRLRWQRAIGRVIASFATKKYHAIIHDLDEQRRRAEAPKVMPAVWLHTTTRFFWRVKARFGVTAYFHPTQRCLEIVAQLLSDHDSSATGTAATEEKVMSSLMGSSTAGTKIPSNSTSTSAAATAAVVANKAETKKKETIPVPVHRIFLDVTKLVDLENKRTASHHLAVHHRQQQLMLQSFDAESNNLLASASVNSIDSTLGLATTSSATQLQQQQQFLLRRGSIDSLSMSAEYTYANGDDLFVVPEQQQAPFTEDMTTNSKDDYVPDRSLVKEVLHRIKADYTAVADGHVTVDQCLYFDASKYIASPVLLDAPKDITASESFGAFKVYRQDEVREKLQQVLQDHQLLSEAVEKAEEFSTRASEAIDRSALEDQLIVMQQEAAATTITALPKSPSSPYAPSRGPKRRPGVIAN